MRRNRAGLKRIGLLTLALVIALGALGVAHAAWTDSVYLEGTVYTGTMDADIAGVSSTYVYKTLDEGIHVEYVYGNNSYTPPTGWIEVASAVAENTSEATDDVDSATMTFTGLFPGVDFMADVEVEYLGTVPGKISLATVLDPGLPQDPTIAELWQMGEDTKDSPTGRYGIWIDAQLSTDNGANWDTIADPLGQQLHRWDLVRLKVHVLLPEDPAYDNLSISFTGLISVIQWNLYEEP